MKVTLEMELDPLFLKMALGANPAAKDEFTTDVKGMFAGITATSPPGTVCRLTIEHDGKKTVVEEKQPAFDPATILKQPK